MNNIFSNLPKFIIFSQVLKLVFIKSDFYYYNYAIIDRIDTFLVGISLLHFILKSKCYSDKKVIFVVSIFLLLQLQLNSEFLNQNQYYLFYITILLITFICSVLYTKKKP